MLLCPKVGAHEYNDRTAGGKTDTTHNPSEFRFAPAYRTQQQQDELERGRLAYPACSRCQRTDGHCTTKFCAPPRRKEQK